MASKMIGFVFLIVVFGGVFLFIYNSGYLTKGITFLKSTVPSYQAANGSPSGGGNGSGGAGSGGAGSSGAGGGYSLSAPPSSSSPSLSDIPPGFTAADLSPYFREIRFGSVSPAPAQVFGSTGYGEITLDTHYSKPSTTIDVTGWEIKTNRGGEYLPQAVEIYDPLGINPQSDIFLKNGDTLHIYSTSAPLNLRLNECLGYLPNRNQFDPPLPQNCPSIGLAGLQAFTGACQDYILSLNGCRAPDLSSPEIPPYDYACRQYLTGKFDYRWCFNTYYRDPNFLSNEVDVWMGSSPLDQYHDRVELLDRQGLLVDYYSY